MRRFLAAFGFCLALVSPVLAQNNGAVFPASSGGASLAGPTTTLGPADAASPTAQALGVQSVVTGTSNTAGAIWSHTDSAGTGTANSGGFSFKAHPAGSTGSTPNAAVTVFNVGQAATAQSGTAYSYQLVAPATGTNYNVSIGTFGSSALNQTTFHQGGAGIYYMNGSGLFGIGVVGFASSVNSAPDTGFSRSAAGVVNLGNGTAANQTGSLIAAQVQLSGVIYSAAGTALPSCATGTKGAHATVSDATSPTYLGTYTSGGAVIAPVFCNGTTWLTD